MRTRFAPSPNGLLHMGHAISAVLAHGLACEMHGEFCLRIEDIDAGRSRHEFVDAIFADLLWLGLDWNGKAVFQSDRLSNYDAAARQLKDRALLYPCVCTRAEIAAAASAAGPEGPVYPGTCKGRQIDLAEPHCWRLDMQTALGLTGPLSWHDRVAGKVTARPQDFGDVVLIRKDAPASYHLAATLDDAADSMTHIVRGKDLFTATHVHRLLQALLDLPTPEYWHHDLLLGADRRKFSKSENAPPLRELRERGAEGTAVLQVLKDGIFSAGISRDNV